MDTPSALFQLGQQSFQQTVETLVAQGLPLNPKLELCVGDDLLCYYHVSRQVIYLSLPDRDTAQGKLQMLLLRSLWACETNDEVFDLLRLTLPWLVAHEIAHHLRHQHDLLSVNVWQEEQIAHQLAMALCKSRFSPDERAHCHWLLQRATHNLVTKLEPSSSAVDSYHHLAHSLHVAGLLTPFAVKQVEYLQRHTGLPSEVILRMEYAQINPPSDIKTRVRNRHQIIKQINLTTSTAKHTVVRHLYYYFGWMDIGLMSSEALTIPEFAYRYLNQEVCR